MNTAISLFKVNSGYVKLKNQYFISSIPTTPSYYTDLGRLWSPAILLFVIIVIYGICLVIYHFVKEIKKVEIDHEPHEKEALHIS